VLSAYPLLFAWTGRRSIDIGAAPSDKDRPRFLAHAIIHVFVPGNCGMLWPPYAIKDKKWLARSPRGILGTPALAEDLLNRGEQLVRALAHCFPGAFSRPATGTRFMSVSSSGIGRVVHWAKPPSPFKGAPYR
jgi:hypothetical protein